ncbi:nuclear transport factor 2 family protein [Acidocella sp.]|uniref:YybH family protein n=1 Tax=Acidocella sp. TaxID=50710 RepID=UPI0026238B7B|nr:nuclear transport factor 2 family protein [Acidocella sp.]
MKADVLATADALIAAFEHNDRAGYFSFFAPEASFVFHAVAHVMHGRAAYEAEYDRWVREDGFQVLECTSTHQHVEMFGDCAVFTHQTHTRVRTNDGESAYDERETIIFCNQNNRWVAVHEHLSLLPG